MRGGTVCGFTLPVTPRKRTRLGCIEANKTHGSSPRSGRVTIDDGYLARANRVGIGRCADQWRTQPTASAKTIAMNANARVEGAALWIIRSVALS
jgi:hypothetical protein